MKSVSTIFTVVTVAQVEGANAPSYKDALTAARDLGKHSAAGDDSYANLGFIIAGLAAKGTLDRTKRNAKGEEDKAGVNGAEAMFNEFLASRAKNASHTAVDAISAGTKAKQQSYFNRFLDCGLLEAEGKAKTSDVLGRAKEIRNTVKDLKLDDAFTGYYRTLGALKDAVETGGDNVDDEAIKRALVKPAKIARGIADKFESILSSITALGKNEHMTPELKAVLDAMTRDGIPGIKIAKAIDAAG